MTKRYSFFLNYLDCLVLEYENQAAGIDGLVVFFK